MNGTYVYLLRSERIPRKKYVGLTRNLERRLAEHNTGATPVTAPHRPWKLIAAIWFADRNRAESFERYLKLGSGHAFAQRHFW